MNKIHRTVWSHARQTYIVTAENAKARGKPSSVVKSMALAVALALGGAGAHATNFDVTQASDDGTGNTNYTLSWAIKQANAAGGTNTITLTTDVTLSGVMKKLIILLAAKIDRF